MNLLLASGLRHVLKKAKHWRLKGEIPTGAILTSRPKWVLITLHQSSSIMSYDSLPQPQTTLTPVRMQCSSGEHSQTAEWQTYSQQQCVIMVRISGPTKRCWCWSVILCSSWFSRDGPRSLLEAPNIYWYFGMSSQIFSLRISVFKLWQIV